ncbi:MAG TPA: hypothetical protein VL727_08645 [Puia sp.]|jgi:hypothetical protein|nr:hypothetical protein [Puia sp.]
MIKKKASLEKEITGKLFGDIVLLIEQSRRHVASVGMVKRAALELFTHCGKNSSAENYLRIE